MPIITECLDCDRPLFASLGIAGTFEPVECEDCGTRLVVENTRMGGSTYREDEFIEDVLPDTDLERIDANADGVYVYGDPEQVTPKPASEVQE